ncbi:MAG: AAA family ATPase [Firmicutes bacterium]|nr:AAA family ATPase [Bacillota bacterium]
MPVTNSKKQNPCKIISIANQKGGVGKTTSCINLSSYLAAMGKKVLIVDIDPQGNASSGLGIDKDNLDYSVYDVIMGECAAADAILPTTVPRLSILPAHKHLSGIELELIQMEQREFILRKALSPLRNHFHYIFIDCPPSLGLLTVNALTVSDSVFVPLQGEFFALEGLTQLMNTIRLGKKHLNPVLTIEGMALTMYDGRSNSVNSIAADVLTRFGKLVYRTKIPKNIRLAEAPSHGLPVMQYDPKSSGSLAYKALAEEFLSLNSDSFVPIDDVAKLRKR